MKQPVICYKPDCDELAVYQCEDCGNSFCAEHGQVGGDELTGEVLVAYPNLCEDCVKESMK